MGWTKNNAALGQGIPGTATFTSTTVPGSLIICMAMVNNNRGFSTPTDTAGNLYVDCGAGLVKDVSGYYVMEMFYALNTSSTASNVVSVASSSAGGAVSVLASEWLGRAKASPVDQFTTVSDGNTGTGGGNNCPVGPVTTLYAGELVVAFGDIWGCSSCGPGYLPVLGGFYEDEYLVQNIAGPISANWPSSYNNYLYQAILCTFRPLPNPAPRTIWI
jgi:hypothetical protein